MTTSPQADKLQRAALAREDRLSPEPVDLDAQIRAAEQAVIERDARIARSIRALGQQARDTVPRRETAVLAAAGAAALGVGALVFRSRRSHDGRYRDRRSERGLWRRESRVVESAPRFPWAGLIPLMWPLLPARWRSRVSPATATAVAGFIATRLGSRLRTRARR